MATTHFERTVFKRGGSSKAGAAQRVQYIQREGAYAPHEVPAQARVDHLAKAFGETLRDDLVHTDHANLPSWAHGSPATFFTAAETCERANGIAYTAWKFSLPRALSRDQQLAAAHDLLDVHFSTKHPYVWAMHEPTAADGGTNPHIHVIWSSRTLDGIERSAGDFFRRYNAADPEKGGAQKSPALTAIGAAKRERITYTDIMNTYLARAGCDERLHPDSHRARGLARAPEPHVLPSDSNKAKHQQEITARWQHVLDSRAERPAHREAEQLDAHHYWQGRTQELGITPTMDHGQALRQIARAREQAITHAPQKMTARERQASVAQSQAVIRATEHHLGALGDALEKEKTFTTPVPVSERTWLQRLFTYPPEPEPLPRPDRAHVQTVEKLLAIDVAALGTPAPARGQAPIAQTITERAAAIRAQGQARSLAEQIRDLSQQVEDISPAGAALRVRLHQEEERERGGMSW